MGGFVLTLVLCFSFRARVQMLMREDSSLAASRRVRSLTLFFRDPYFQRVSADALELFPAAVRCFRTTTLYAASLPSRPFRIES